MAYASEVLFRHCWKLMSGFRAYFLSPRGLAGLSPRQYRACGQWAGLILLSVDLCVFHTFQFHIQFHSHSLSLYSGDWSVGGDRKMLCIGGKRKTKILFKYVCLFFVLFVCFAACEARVECCDYEQI